MLQRISSLTVGLSMVACAALAASTWHARTVCANFAERCTALQQENETLRNALDVLGEKIEQCAGTKSELVIKVDAGEFTRKKTRAIRNRNYMSVKRLADGEVWKGQLGWDSEDHIIFEHPAYSIRAGAMVIKNYEKKHGLKTIRQFVMRYCEGNRENYMQHLSKALGVGIDEEFSYCSKMVDFIKAVVFFEMHEPLPDELLALVELPK